MTETNQKQNALDELAVADRCLAEARALHAAGFHYGAASRAYYAVFHAMRALLFGRGLEVKSHRGAVGAFGEHFVKSGMLPARLGRLVSRMQRDREDADYVVGAVFTEIEAATAVADAQESLEAMRKLVVSL